MHAARNTPRIPGKTVYFLGSGFSKPYGLPVIADFLEEGMNHIKSTHQGPLAHRMMRLLDQYIPALRMVCNHQESPSIADLFCIVDLLEPRDTGYRRTLEEFVVAVCQKSPPGPSGIEPENLQQPQLQVEGYLTALQPKVSNSPCGTASTTISAYDAFVAHLLAPRPPKSRPTVISLNYDLVLEHTVQHLARNYCIGTKRKYPLRVSYGDRVDIGKDCRSLLVKLKHRDPGTLYLIKLHGSINWHASGPASRQRVLVDSCASSGFQENQGRNTLIWPSWLRGSFESFWADLLGQARQELKLASEIVIVGYSMPTLDRYIKYLFADVLSTPELPAVTICGNESEESIRRAWAEFAGTLGQKVRLRIHPHGFVSFCQELVRSAHKSESEL
ncbi:hypothetical protein DB347_24660 [Opitutaceae bacterium EW11]|nr:hypothetical protein DB347_24660 [Opitutaceae bacterium EW11]